MFFPVNCVLQVKLWALKTSSRLLYKELRILCKYLFPLPELSPMASGGLLTNFAPLLAEVVFVRQICDLLQIRKL